MTKTRLVGPEYDLYDAIHQELAARGLKQGFLTEDELRVLCASIIRHAERLNIVLKAATETSH